MTDNLTPQMRDKIRYATYEKFGNNIHVCDIVTFILNSLTQEDEPIGKSYTREEVNELLSLAHKAQWEEIQKWLCP